MSYDESIEAEAERICRENEAYIEVMEDYDGS